MPENLVHRLEETVMSLLSEKESLHNELNQLHRENALLKAEKNNATEKLQRLVQLLDEIDIDLTYQPLVVAELNVT